jgi:hypothetical protein
MDEIMMGVKEAVKAAIIYFNELQSISSLNASVQDLRLEEVEISKDRSEWLVTLGYTLSENGISICPKREYKVFAIDISSGEFQSMKIREV